MRLPPIKSEFPTVTDFEREFPSFCFALATGVGKTRLMGAFITTFTWRMVSIIFCDGAEPDHLQQACHGLHFEYA